MKLTPRLTLIFVAYAAILLGIVGGLASASGRASLRAATASELEATALEKEAALDAWVEDKRNDLAVLAAEQGGDWVRPLVDEPLGSAEWRLAYQWFWRSVNPTLRSGEFTVFMLLNPETGEVVASTDPGEQGRFKEDRLYFLQGRLGPYVQSVYYSISLQLPAMTAAAPIRGPQDELIAVLAGRIELDELGAIVRRRTGLHQTDDAFLVNASNLFVTQPRLHVDPAVLQRGVHTEAVERCLDRESGVLDQIDSRGLPAITAYRWLPEHGICLIVKLDQEEAYAPAQEFSRTVAIISGAALLGAAALAIIFATGLSRPILALTDGVARFGRDLTTRLPDASRDELGTLARAFNTMAESLEEKDAHLRARSAELEAANKELEAFSYSISHDLRAPLRAADGFARILLDEYCERVDDQGRRYLERIRHSTQQMGRLIDDLLGFSRLNRQALTRRVVKPQEVALAALDELEGERTNRPVVVSIDEMPEVRADPSLLHQVYANLLSNALKFTRHRDPGRISVGAVPRNGEVVFHVRDDGVGFDMAYAHKLFGVFQRLHRVEDYEGTGVGLAIVQRIIHRHGGRVWAEAVPEQGAAFYFTLPQGREG